LRAPSGPTGGSDQASAAEDGMERGAADAGGPKVRLGTRLLATVSGKDTLALVDQAVVSGTSFLTTVMIGRWAGAEELGVYSLGLSLLVSGLCVQESLIALPYTICRHRALPGTPAEYAGSVLVHQGLFSALALIVLAAAATVLSLGGGLPALAGVVWALQWVLPFALLREFGRRFAFAHLRMAEALVLDLAVALVQFAGLAWLASTGALNAVTAYSVIGAACALTGAVWLYLARGHFAPRRSQVRPALRQSWSMGKWLFASQVTLSVQAYFVHWLLAGCLGTTATGVYAACMTVVQFSNPLTLGIGNSLAPRAAHAFADGGSAALRQIVFRTTVLVGLAMALFCVAIFVGGDELMSVLYHGQLYEGHGHTVEVLALAMLAAALGMPASIGLAALERPEVIFKVGLVAVGLTVVLVPCLVLPWGVTGAAYGFLAGNVAGSVGRWLAFSALVKQWHSQSASAALTRVLQGFTQCSPEKGWLIEPLNEGAQANVFAVRAADAQPVWQSYHELVVKLYKSSARKQTDVVGDQFASMSQLHAQLGGIRINDWTIHSPIPLYECDRAFALVMTRVPGSSLSACLRVAGRMDTQTMQSIADTVISVMEHCWLTGSQIYGDFNFDNILCDPDTRSLSFVDPGVRENDFLCEGVAKQWYPASRDLAHLLYENEVGVKRTLGNPGARRRQRALAEGMLRAFLRRIGPRDQRYRLLDEVHACARIHLQILRGAWTPRGIWRLYIRHLASRRIDEILARLRVDIDRSL
jgi:O-antigen/teichoic acid export membrane protein